MQLTESGFASYRCDSNAVLGIQFAALNKILIRRLEDEIDNIAVVLRLNRQRVLRGHTFQDFVECRELNAEHRIAVAAVVREAT